MSQDLLAALDRDGVFASVNPAWTRTLGYAASDLVGRPVSDLLGPKLDAWAFGRYDER